MDEAMGTVATLVAAACAVIAAAVAVWVWRQARGADLGKRIDDGDAAVRLHADQALNRIGNQVDEVSEHIDTMRDAVARIEARQETEEQHVLRPRDLGAIHEKVNRVAEELAAVRAQSSVETRMLSEQLKVLQQLMQANLQSRPRQP